MKAGTRRRRHERQHEHEQVLRHFAVAAGVSGARERTASTIAYTTNTSGPPIAGVSGTDAQGFVGHTARCTEGSTPAAAIRTAQSLAVICETGPGNYQYRGERLRDGANVQLNARALGNGFVTTNPADGARYDVQPGMLTISSNGSVDSAEPALEYGSADR